jgi:hypothetical protein
MHKQNLYLAPQRSEVAPPEQGGAARNLKKLLIYLTAHPPRVNKGEKIFW